MKEKDLAILEAFLSLILFLFLRCNPRFPLAYKSESRAPHERDESIEIRTRSEYEINTQEHDTNTGLSSDRALSIYSLLPPETWDPFHLSPICNPYYKLLALVTRATMTNWT